VVEETPRVLVVDDDEPIRRMLTMSLELDGFEVASASDGLEAIIQVGLFCPDVVVLDIMMPRMDGLTALGHLRRQPETADIPVVLLSAKADSTDIAIGIRAGASDYVTKPFDADDLVSRIRSVITPSSAPFARERPSPRTTNGASSVVTKSSPGTDQQPLTVSGAASMSMSAQPLHVSVPQEVPATLPAIPPPPQNLPSVPSVPARRSVSGDEPLELATSGQGIRRQLLLGAVALLVILVAAILALTGVLPKVSI
jgi:DNA-binding response OmpR family regulator